MDPTIGDEMVTECACCHRVVLCRWDVDPYAAEVHDDHTPLWECDDCAAESAGDI